MWIGQQICFWTTVALIASAAASVASVGTSIYSAVTADKGGGGGEPPPTSNADIEAAERLRRRRMGLKQTWATRGTNLGQAKTTGGALKSTLG